MKLVFGMNISILTVNTLMFWVFASMLPIRQLSVLCGILGAFSLLLAILNFAVTEYFTN